MSSVGFDHKDRSARWPVSGRKGITVLINYKGCIRCGGDVTKTKDWYGEYVRCLQCGWSKDTAGDSLSSLIEFDADSGQTAAQKQEAS
jgi:hypothetical protein